MENVLAVRNRSYDSSRPLVCLYEASKQLPAEMRKAIAVEPGKAKRIDAEYRRCGISDACGGRDRAGVLLRVIRPSASVSDQKCLVTPARTGILETGGGGSVAAIPAVAPAALRLCNNSGTITHGDGSTSSHA